MTKQANIFPKNKPQASVTFSDNTRVNLGYCFSGGGSRALTGAWGQYLGLSSLNVLEKARYISSVSGGTWAASIYTYLPDHISDVDLLGRYYPPAALSLTGEADTFNVNELGKYSLGQAPKGSTLDNLILWGAAFLFCYREDPSKYKWLWASLVAKLILEPFGLREQGDAPWTSQKYYSLSQAYAWDYFPEGAPSSDEFFFVRPGRPFLIINDNLMQKVSVEGGPDAIVQLPNQATAVATGVQGETPDAAIIGGGSVETYAYNSNLQQRSAIGSPVKVNISKPYSLIDSVSTSSAFFAKMAAGLVQDALNDDVKRKELSHAIAKNLREEVADIEGFIEKPLQELVAKAKWDLGSFVPSYNYWPLAERSENTQTQYTDGGTLENTGILGMLAQTDTGGVNAVAISLVAFDNTSTPLVKVQGKIVAAGQAAALFGINFDDDSGLYRAYTDREKDPQDSNFKGKSLIQIFDNSAGRDGMTPFDNLVNGLYAASCNTVAGQVPDDAKVNSAPAFFRLSLTTLANPLANISAGRSVDIFYVQNAKILAWQNAIGDTQLLAEIVNGQSRSAPTFDDFKSFPYYSTVSKIGLKPKESNALSQMWAWAIADDASTMKRPLQVFISQA